MGRVQDLKYFDYLRENKIWCNASVVSSDNEEFEIHTPILMASSEFFCAAYQFGPFGGKKGAARKSVTALGVPANVLEPIIRFMYLGEIELEKSTAWNILRASDFLQIHRLTRICLQYLHSIMCFKTCANLLDMTFSQNVFLPQIADIARQFALENMCNPHCPVAERHEFVCSLNVDVLLSLLTSSKLNAPHEHFVWHSICWWVGADPVGRYANCEKLLRAIRLGCLPKEFVTQTIMEHEAVKSNAAILESIRNREEALEARLNNEEDAPTEDDALVDLVPRLQNDLIIAIGGWAEQGPCNECYVYDMPADKWIHVPEVDVAAGRTLFAYHGLVQLGQYLYLVGGTDNLVGVNRDNARCYRIDLQTFKMETIVPLSTSRNFVGCAELRGQIYAIGGRTEGHRRLSTAEMYDPGVGEWTEIPKMSSERSDAGVALLNEKIYVVGGFDGRNILGTAECYDAETEKWEAIPDMYQPRSGLRCVAAFNHVFVLGGYSGSHRLSSVERYDPAGRQWQVMAPMNVERSNMTAVVVHNLIIVIGGYSKGSIVDNVSIYDIFTNEWYEREPLPSPRSALNAVVISGDSSLRRRLLGEARETYQLTKRRPALPGPPADGAQLPEGRRSLSVQTASESTDDQREDSRFSSIISAVLQTFVVPEEEEDGEEWVETEEWEDDPLWGFEDSDDIDQVD